MLGKNYHSIIRSILDYLPSRALIILNSILIIPLLVGILDPKEISIYFIAIQILNLLCTCSFDGIGKAVLRFYEKYRINGILDKFFSNILWMSIGAYGLIIILYPLLHNYICEKYTISNSVLILTLILVIPCGIRQVFYQILRIKNLSNVYTLSIIFYQLILIINILYFTRIIPKTDIVIGGMILSVILTDIYIIYNAAPKFKIEYKMDKNIILEVLKYILPLFVTNFGYWFILNFLKFEFQNMHQYLNTAIIGTSWVIANNFLQPLVTLFIFSTFPIIIKKFEHNSPVKNYFTNICQLYMFMFVPLISVFCAYPREICVLLLPEVYEKAAFLLPIFAIATFSHEFLKLINVKYHLNNKTYIETSLAVLFVLFSFFGTTYMATRESIIGASLILLACEAGLMISNIIIRFKNLNYIKYTKVIKTLFFMLIISIISYTMLMAFDSIALGKIMCIMKIIIFITLNYIISLYYRKYLLS